MKRIAQPVSWLALAGTIVPSILFLLGTVNLGTVKSVMLVSTVAWFIAAYLWMEQG